MLHKNQVLTLIFLFKLISLNLNAQSVGININPHESAALHIESTSQGILIPAMNSAERENILNPKKGLLVYDLSTASFWFFKGAEWEELNSGDGTFVNNNGIIHNSGDINNDHFVFGADELPDRVTSDTLFMFNKAKGAFRTGSILSSLNWDDSRVGQNSFGAGHNTEASGNNSIALGNNTKASGSASLALGRLSQALSNYALASGSSTVAMGGSSTAMGQGTKAEGVAATALGNTTKAIGDNSFAVGHLSIASGGTSAAIGSQNEATKTASLATGIQTTADAKYSFAAGRGTIAKSDHSFVFGRFNEGLGSDANWVSTDPVLEIGIGDSANNLKNALTILKNGNHGIGVSNPVKKFELSGDAKIEFASASGSPHLELVATGNDGYNRINFRRELVTTSNWTLASLASSTDANSRFNIYFDGKDYVGNILSVVGTGKVGINTTPSEDAFHVNANSGDHGLRVQINNFTKLRVLQNGGVSIGTNNVAGTPNNGLYVSGNIGVGVNNPSNKLEVDGGIKIGSSTVEEEGTIRFNSTSKCFEGYDGSEWVPFNRKYKVGDLAHGGIVFYIDESGEHGYVCSETDFPAGANWAPGGFLNYLHIGGGGLGGGSFLTETIVREYGLLGSSSNNYAAALCRNLIENGYSDWYLPNLDEATLMWNNLADSDQDGINSGPGDPNNLGNFEAAQYWTAQELGPSNPENAIGKSFADNSIIILSKFSFLSVRAIRKF